MRPNKHETTTEGDLFRARFEQIINMKYELVQFTGKIDWAWLDVEMAPLYSDKGRPGIESRFVIGLLRLICSGCPTKASVSAGSTIRTFTCVDAPVDARGL